MRKFKIIIFLFSILFINNSTAQCWFNNLLLDANADSKLSAYFKNASKEDFNAYKSLQTSGSNYVKTSPSYLEKFSKISAETQVKIANFTDDKAGSTLTKFLDDCDDAEFLKFINNSDNELQVKGFLAHKNGILTDAENANLSEMLNDISEIPNDKARKWLEYGDNQAVFKKNREAGTAWGKKMTSQLADKTSEAYLVLKAEFAKVKKNLDEYTIYEQVQLCLKGDCISKGNYWVPDFVAVIEKTNAKGTYLETIIIDSKLSQFTDLTSNQNAAQKLGEWTIKSIPDNSKIIGKEIVGFGKSIQLKKDGSFIKLYSDNGIPKTIR